MFRDLTQALAIARTAIDELAREPPCDLTADELDGLSFAVQVALKAIDLIAAAGLFPLKGSVEALPAIREPHERAIAALRFALNIVGKAEPINHDSRRVVYGVRFIVDAVIYVLVVALPEGPASVRYSSAA